MKRTTRTPPRKRPGRPTGPRTIDGAMLDVRAASAFLGVPQKALRARVARQLVPYRRWGGRLVFLKDELVTFVRSLPGCALDQAVENLRGRRGE